MRKLFYLLIIFSITFFLSGCLKTLFPIFHESDVMFNSDLLGSWKYTEDNKKKFIEFNKIPQERKKELAANIGKIADKGYLVSKMDSTGKIGNQWFVFLAIIGKNYYLDYYPAEMPAEKKVNIFYKQHFLKVHTSYRIDFTDKDHFEMKQFDKTFLDKLISNNKINIRHEVVEGNNIITASTDELQKFILQYGDNSNAFETGIKCERSLEY